MSERVGIMGQTFYKMTGSGNDFVFFDTRTMPADGLERPEVIAKLAARGVGVGADGVVFLASSPNADLALRYYNADGSLAALCGNATLCTTSLATQLGGVDHAGFTIETGSGVLQARLKGGVPEFDFPGVTVVKPEYPAIPMIAGELRLGFALAGVPHVVIQVADLTSVDVVGRGRPIRFDRSLAEGANVNFVAKTSDGEWAIRTYERGVENETLACGTGNVSAAILLNVWGEASGDVRLLTRSGQPQTVRTQRGNDGIWHPSLQGEGRLVFTGELGQL